MYKRCTSLLYGKMKICHTACGCTKQKSHYSKAMQQVPFNTIFQVNTDGSLTAHVSIRVAGVTLAAGGTLYKGQSIGGIDFTHYVGRQFQVEVEDGTYVIKGIYA